MDAIGDWWRSLDQVNQWFYGAAAFFGAVFAWQIVSTFLGLGGHDDTFDSQADADWQHQTPEDVHDTVVAFKLLSIRSVLAFFTLFTWAAALYMDFGVPLVRTLVYSLLWGILGMVLVSLIFFIMRRMTETGNLDIATSVGAAGTVHLDIPETGDGEVRVVCSRIMTHLKARSAGGAIKAGTPIRVKRVLGPNTVEVEADSPTPQRKEPTA